MLFSFSFDLIDKGEAICLKMGSREHATGSDTTTPFGKAYYKRDANFFVFPYTMLLVISATTTVFSAMYWSLSAVGSAQVLKYLQIHLHHFELFAPRWYRFGILYAPGNLVYEKSQAQTVRWPVRQTCGSLSISYITKKHFAEV
jgi:hypothetical protein